jgi:hypothetical protein
MTKTYKNSQIALALSVLKPNAEWVLRGDDYSKIEWLSDNEEKPTLEQVISQIENPIISPEVEAKATARAAILDRLGITAEEAAILLG